MKTLFDLEKRVMLKVPGDPDVMRYVSHFRSLLTAAERVATGQGPVLDPELARTVAWVKADRLDGEG